MKLGDKASDSPEISLVRQSAPGLYRLRDGVSSVEEVELQSADEVTPEGEFPEYGDFLPVVRVKSGDGEHLDRDEEFVECPSVLARSLVGWNVTSDDVWRLQSYRKVDGEWQLFAQLLDEDGVVVEEVEAE